jgi:hypothetical protein
MIQEYKQPTLLLRARAFTYPQHKNEMNMNRELIDNCLKQNQHDSDAIKYFFHLFQQVDKFKKKESLISKFSRYIYE